MPRIFDNIAQELLPALRQTLELSDRSDFSVGYSHLRGWKAIGSLIEQWPRGEGHQCRLLIANTTHRATVEHPAEGDASREAIIAKQSEGELLTTQQRAKLGAEPRRQIQERLAGLAEKTFNSSLHT